MRRLRNRYSRGTYIAAAVLVIAVVLLFTVGKAYFSLPGVWSAESHQVRQVRLEPLATFRHYRVWWGPWLNLGGNIALFMPVGWVAYRLLGDVKRATLAGAGFSLVIEVLQYVLAAGYSDVDDILFNTLGAFAGAYLARALR
ncbi:VanZ family protein [Corynebacterium aquatimens]|uniref:VanZ family protein n=1 Tax=Corynebacterium TaxID=1716 RepID=UPI001F37BC07|nr:MULTISPECIES: VanZ family protein [Corynebacterium]QYH19044.1 VanZ family protein [Corynebacterium aquatimens]UIZ92106.1 VanZ family protein [Corynebacterium sp. CNCTC7651]